MQRGSNEQQAREHEVYLLSRAVVDRHTFLVFAKEFQRLRREIEEGKFVDNWESGSIASFLGGAIAWADDSDFGTRQDLSDSNPWEQFAAFIWCGKIYE